MQARKYIWVECVLILIVSLSSGAYAESASVWFDRMNRVVRELNYTGTYVYISDGRIDTMQIVHRVDDKGERERLFSLNGEVREILRDSKEVTCILPANKSVIVGELKSRAGLSSVLPDNIQGRDLFYNIELIGHDRIAGYSTVILAVEPKDKMRYGYRIWLEEHSGMVLRSDVLDSQENVIEQMMFTEISFQSSPISAEMLEPAVEYSQFQVITDHSVSHGSTPDESIWSFLNMPRGFRIASQSFRTMPMKKHRVQHFVLSDGIATVSIYIEKSIPGGRVLEGETSMGSVNVYGRKIVGHQVTVMGEVPKATIRQIAQAIVRN